MVDFGSEQGLSDFETDSVAVIVSTGIAHAILRISKERKRSSGPKDAVYGWALT